MQTDRNLVCVFLLCGLVAPLFAAEPKLSDRIAKAPANQWTEIQSDDFGGRFASSIAYMPSVNAMMGWGARVHSKKIRSYDVEHFDLATAQWIEAFPPGKEAWKAKPRQWGDWSMSGSGHFYERDGVKLPRPLMSYWQMAWDAHKKRMIYYVAGLTFAYDPVKRAWTPFKTGPVGPPLRLMGSAMVAMPDRKKIVLFGGFGCENPEGRPRTWIFDCEKDEWVRPEFGSAFVRGLQVKTRALGARCRRLRRAAQDLEKLLPADRMAPGAALADQAEKLSKDVADLMVQEDIGRPEDDMRALIELRSILHASSPRLTTAAAYLRKGEVRLAALTITRAEDYLRHRAMDELRVEPPPRCNAPLAYDSRNRRVVVFGGDHLDYQHADTWTLGVKRNRWEPRRPKPSPPAQSGHAMCYLDKSGLVFLSGPKGNWTFDAGKGVWTPVPGAAPKAHAFTVAAVPGTDIVIGCAAWSWDHRRKTYVYRFEPGAQAKHKEFATTTRRGPAPKTQAYSRKWFDDVPPADPTKSAAFLKSIPDNTWTTVKVPKKLRARTWSSCTFDARRREIIYWGGGHSGNVNSNVDHFSLHTGRWSTNVDPMWKPWPFGKKAACPNGRTYQNEPWTMHARKTYAWDPVSGMVVMANVGGGGHYRLRTKDGVKTGKYTYIYHPAWGEWIDVFDTPFRVGYHGAAASTPQGVLLLDGGQLWLLDVKGKKWTKYGPSERLPAGEYFTTVYDSKRDRLIYLAGQRKRGTRQTDPVMHVFDIKTKKWTKSSPEGVGCYSRDAAYVPGQDAVFAHAGSGAFKVYLCAENKWIDTPTIQGARRGISEQALTIDPKTELILFIDARAFCGPFDLKAFRLNVAKLTRD